MKCQVESLLGAKNNPYSFSGKGVRFHNSVVDLLLLVEFPGDIFAEAKRIVIHHYQWAVVNDFLKRICGAIAVSNALTSVVAPIG